MMLTVEDAAETPSHTEVVDDSIEQGHLDNDLGGSDHDTEFYDYSYNDAAKYVYVL